MTDQTDLDLLKVALKNGMDSATRAFSRLIADEVKAEMIGLNVINVEQVGATMMNQEELVSAILMKITGELEGAILFTLQPQTAIFLAKTLIGDKSKSQTLNAMDQSALNELANIITGNGLQDFENMLGVNITYSIPHNTQDTLSAITDSIISEFAERHEKILMIELNFIFSDSHKLKTFFFISVKASNPLLNTLQYKSFHAIDKVIKVNTAEFGIGKSGQILETNGIGSCIVVCLYEKFEKTGALLHIMLPHCENTALNPLRFADTALPFVLNELEKIGIQKKNLEAHLVGGASMFSDVEDHLKLGEKNREAVEILLTSYGIPIKSKDIGGNTGRNVKFFLDTGTVEVSIK